MLKTTHRSCPRCKEDNKGLPPHKLSSEEWKLKQCAGCGFLYLENAPVYENLSEDHAWEKSSKVEEVRRQQAHGLQDTLSKATRFRFKFPRKHVLSLLEQFAPDGRVLDLGCGNAGYMLQMAPRHQPCGIEISKELAETGKKNLAPRGGFVIHAPALEGMQQLPEKEFAGVVMRAYLEHELKPAEVLIESFRILKPSGILIIKVPNYGSINAAVMGKSWCGLRLPDHLNYFTPTLLSDMVKKAGYQIHKFGMLSFRQPTSDNMWMIARRES